MRQPDASIKYFSEPPRTVRSGGASETARVVHDLGNLIQIASSAINLLARNSHDRDARTEQIVSGAQLSLKRAGELVRQTLAEARSERPPTEPVSLAEMLREIELLSSTGWDARFRFHLRLVGELPEVSCDPVGLRNAILNLVANARDAMPDGGDIGLAGISRKDGTEVEICVVDNGKGMTDDTVRRAREPFFTTKMDGLGGVGLPSVERFVREAGGRLEIQSRPGVGTIVMMQLPSADAQMSHE